jgi:hypothetical protein
MGLNTMFIFVVVDLILSICIQIADELGQIRLVHFEFVGKGKNLLHWSCMLSEDSDWLPRV